MPCFSEFGPSLSYLILSYLSDLLLASWVLVLGWLQISKRLSSCVTAWAASSRINSMCNGTQPIYRLPPEILAAVIEFYQSEEIIDYHQKAYNWVRFMLVSRAWKTMVLLFPSGQGLSQADRFHNQTCSLLLRGPVCTFYGYWFPIWLHGPWNRDSFIINMLTSLPPHSMVEWSLILNNRFSLWDGGRGRNISRDKPWNNMGTNWYKFLRDTKLWDVEVHAKNTVGSQTHDGHFLWGVGHSIYYRVKGVSQGVKSTIQECFCGE